MAATQTKRRETAKTANGNQTGKRRQNGCFRLDVPVGVLEAATEARLRPAGRSVGAR